VLPDEEGSLTPAGGSDYC